MYSKERLWIIYEELQMIDIQNKSGDSESITHIKSI